MSWDLVLRHCAAIKASVTQQQVALELVASQVDALAAFAKTLHDRAQVPTARIEKPDHCRGIEECALDDEDAREPHRSFAHPRAWVCRGCRALSSNGATLDA